MNLRGPSSVLSRHWLFGPGRLGRSRVHPIPLSHSYYSATAKFTDIDPKGVPISNDTGIMVGEPHESYIYIEPEVGNAIRSSIIGQLGSGAASSSATLPLQFHHESRSFAHKSIPLPCIDVPHDLGRSSGNFSPATLWLSGNWYAITLDGSPDENFERLSRETAIELKGALDKLEDS